MFNNTNQIQNFMSNDSGTDTSSLGFDTDDISEVRMEVLEKMKSRILYPVEHQSYNLSMISILPDEIAHEVRVELIEFYLNNFKLIVYELDFITNDSSKVVDFLEALYKTFTDNILGVLSAFIIQSVSSDTEIYYNLVKDDINENIDVPFKFLQNNKIGKKEALTLITINKLFATKDVCKIAFSNVEEFAKLFEEGSHFNDYRLNSFINFEYQEEDFLGTLFDTVFNSELFSSLLASKIKLSFCQGQNTGVVSNGN